jgi:hypothetical protein
MPAPHVPSAPHAPAGLTLPTRRTRPAAPAVGRRFGYVVAVIVNAVMLYVVHHLLEWRWPSFLTGRFEEVLPLMTVSLVASMIANVLFIGYDAGWFKSLANIVTTSIALAATVRILQVFPFDFTTMDRDWTVLMRVALLAVIAGTAIAIVVELIKLVSWPLREEPAHDA